MAFDDAKWNEKASQGNLGAVAIATKAALDHISLALLKLAKGESIAEQLKGIEKHTKWLDKMADDMTGYTPDDD